MYFVEFRASRDNGKIVYRDDNRRRIVPSFVLRTRKTGDQAGLASRFIVGICVASIGLLGGISKHAY